MRTSEEWYFQKDGIDGEFGMGLMASLPFEQADTRSYSSHFPVGCRGSERLPHLVHVPTSESSG